VKLLLLVDVVALLAALAIFAVTRDDPGTNAVNDGLQGSRPPAGRTWPRVDRVELDPPLPRRAQLADAPAVLVATCLDCRSGDIIGGFLGLLGADHLPGHAAVHVLAWGGSAKRWRAEWSLPETYEVHVAASEQESLELRRALAVNENGFARVYDPRGRWRSTFHTGQLDREQLRDDLSTLAR